MLQAGNVGTSEAQRESQGSLNVENEVESKGK